MPYSHLSRRIVPTFAVCGLLALGAGCGKEGPPQPPLRSTPRAASDLAVSQRGPEWRFEFSYPATTVSGTALPALTAVELWRLHRPVAAPVTPDAALVAPSVDPREFQGAAQSVLRIEGAELASAIQGDRIRLRFPVAASASAAPAGASEIATPTSSSAQFAEAFAVRSIGRAGAAGRDDASDFSNVIVVIPGTAPAAPARLSATSAEGLVRLEWPSIEGSSGYRIYRREAIVRSFGAPLAATDAATSSYEDRAVVYGRRYVYAIVALGAGTPPIESAAPVEREIDYADRFAPAPPLRPVALPGQGQIRLVWQSSPADDVQGYVVFRAREGGDFERVHGEPLTALEFIDAPVAAGTKLRYRVAAIDRSGNLGEPSEVVETSPL